MAPVPLNVTPALRPWRQAGVTHLLRDGPVLQALPEQRMVSAPLASAPSPLPEAASAPVRKGAITPSFSDGTPHEGERLKAVCSAETPLFSTGLPLDRWPEAWKKLLPNPLRRPSLLWSYEGLAVDLVTHPHERSAFLQRLLRDLAMPPGSHMFWPLCPPPDTAVDPVFFFSGVEVLNPPLIVFLGDVPALRLPSLPLLQPQIHGGRRYVRLHELDALALDVQRNLRRYTSVVSFLKTLRGVTA